VATALRQPDGLTLTASVGYGELDPAEPTARRLVRDADSGLYEAKSKGRDRAAHAYGLPDVEGSIDDDPILLLANEKLMNDRLRAADRVAAEALSILDAYQSASTVGLGFVDAHFRILRVNPMLASVNGGDVEDQLGKTLAEVVPALWAQLEATYRAVIEHGAQVVNLEVTGEMATDPGHPHSWLTNLYPVELAGEIIGIGIVVVDVTDRKRLAESQSALTRAVVDALANAVEMRDPYTAGHQGRVGQMAVNLAVELGIEAEEVKAIELAARIHDVGKIVVPAELLSRPGRLTEIERQLVRSHASAGADLLARSDFPSHVREMVFQHHERLDGSGYPRGLTAEHIALGSRILTVADVYDAMSSARPYRSALDPDVVIKELTDGSGTLYDPAVVAACLRLIADGRTTRVGDDAGSSVHPHVAR
jgi:putative nucleotidyltransferase with HDIG domain/PAS domain S-box-containing protein